ncbi:hypothetical protein C8J57DRAFT_1338583 [Mycena rebaudengoi]|nr:hypothetical protein C8J57DRAFT_1338583 [Mycena rebaudengoi]
MAVFVSPFNLHPPCPLDTSSSFALLCFDITCLLCLSQPDWAAHPCLMTHGPFIQELYIPVAASTFNDGPHLSLPLPWMTPSSKSSIHQVLASTFDAGPHLLRPLPLDSPVIQDIYTPVLRQSGYRVV